MKNFILALCFLMFCGSCSFYRVHHVTHETRVSAKIKWNKYSENVRSKKPILLYISNNNVFSGVLEKKILTKLSIIDLLNDNFYCVKVEEGSDLYVIFKEKYDIEKFPTIVLVSRSGLDPYKITEYLDPDMFKVNLKLFLAFDAIVQ